MKEKIYVGIDLAKGSSRVAALDEAGEAILKPFSITNSKEGVKKLLPKLSGYKACQIVCGMEISLKLLGEHVPILKRDECRGNSFKPLSGKEMPPGYRSQDKDRFYRC